MYVFLRCNGYKLDIPKESAIDAMVKIVRSQIEENALAALLEQNSYKVQSA